MLSEVLFVHVIANSRCVCIYEAILISSTTSVELAPVLTHEVLLKIWLVHKVFVCKLSIVVMNLLFGKYDFQVDNTAYDRKERHVHGIVFYSILSHYWHSNSAVRCIAFFVISLCSWFSILVVWREIHTEQARLFDEFLILTVRKVHLTRRHIFRNNFVGHVSILYAINRHKLTRLQDILTVFISDEAFQLVA